MAEELRISHYLVSLNPALGGMTAHVTDLAALTADSGLRVRLYSAAPDPRPETVGKRSRVEVIATGRPAFAGRAMSRSQVRRLASELADSDLVHLHGCWDPVSAQLAARLRKLRHPYIVTPHGMLDDWCMSQKSMKKRVFMILVGARYLAGAERLLYCAQGELEQSQRWTGGRPGVVIPAAMDLQPFAQLPGPEEACRTIAGASGEGPVVLFLSRVDPKKGLEVLIDAMAELQRRGRTVPLIIAGPGNKRYVDVLRQRAQDAGLASSTHFVGMVKGRAKVSLMQRASVFALSTKQENFGLVLTEALAARTPVITTKGVDIWPEIEAHHAGLICDRTPGSFADAIEQLLDEPELADQMGSNGREWVVRDLDASVLTAKFVSTYEAVVGEQSSRT